MKNLKLSTLLLICICFLINFTSHAQIEVSEILQESKIVETESNKLYFLDFWATWCGPCVYSKKILTVLQQQHPKNFHVISISEENPAKVERFLKKNPTLLTVVIDNNGEAFKDYNIKALPQGILFNAKGNKLWEGHPSDLTPELLTSFLKRNKASVPLNKFIRLVEFKANVSSDYEPKDDIEINVTNLASKDLEILSLNTHFKLQGSLLNILSHLSNINKKQIVISPVLNKTYSIYINKTLFRNKNLDLKVLDMLGLSVNEESTIGEALKLKVTGAKFWDTKQIDWGNNETRFLVSDNDISADNVSLLDLSYQLSKALDTPVIVESSDNENLYSLHDWQINYKYFEFMKTNLEEYGITVKKETTDYPKFIIIKKAP